MLDEVSMGETAPKPFAERKRAYGILGEAKNLEMSELCNNSGLF